MLLHDHLSDWILECGTMDVEGWLYLYADFQLHGGEFGSTKPWSFQGSTLQLLLLSFGFHLHGVSFSIPSYSVCFITSEVRVLEAAYSWGLYFLGEFSPSMLKVIIDMYVPIIILLIVFWLFCNSCSFLFLLLASSVIWFSVVVCLGSFLSSFVYLF